MNTLYTLRHARDFISDARLDNAPEDSLAEDGEIGNAGFRHGRAPKKSSLRAKWSIGERSKVRRKLRRAKGGRARINGWGGERKKKEGVKRRKGSKRVISKTEGVEQRSDCLGTWNERACGILISDIPETTDHPTLLSLALPCYYYYYTRVDYYSDHYIAYEYLSIFLQQNPRNCK